MITDYNTSQKPFMSAVRILIQPCYLFVLLWLVSCTSDTVSQTNDASLKDTIAKVAPVQEPVHSDTLLQNGIRLIQYQKNNRLQTLLTLSEDTIVKAADYYHQISFPDINKDGY